MKRCISVAFAWLLQALFLHGQQPLVVGMELEYPPFEFVGEDGKNDGVSVRMAEALAKHLGRPLEIQNIKFDALITALKSGSIDLIISSMTANDERRKSINFSVPYVTTGLAMLVPKGSEIEGIEGLKEKGRRVVVKLGTTGEAFAREYLKDAKILTMQQDPTCALEVAQGKADVWIYDQLSIFQHHKQHAETTKALLNPIRKEQWAIGIRKPKAGEEDSLREDVNGFLKVFRDSGQFEALADTYLREEKELLRSLGVPFIFDIAPTQVIASIGEETEAQFESDPLFLLFLGILVALAVFAFWNLTREGLDPGKSKDVAFYDLIGFAILWLVFTWVCYFIFSSINRSYTWNWEGIWDRRWQIFGGWLRTLWISFFALVLCIGVGIGLVIGFRSPWRPVRLRNTQKATRPEVDFLSQSQYKPDKKI